MSLEQNDGDHCRYLEALNPQGAKPQLCLPDPWTTGLGFTIQGT